ncbi:adenine phosphoribosyltransferase [Balneicella halophila]|uniref:Adenine phosphoribosyltransferase n=1 Tax=Balneicella halophila TaxID=1537566 RepID=A0A7L4US56_BALHA|nr:adenine phosphoribosyltransferase [Balneicella halophila]PVX52615.1 adenine phosphoribosyltransferase [Balneicella halophila]
MNENMESAKQSIRDVLDFPKKGIVFKDITTLLKEHKHLATVADHIYDYYKDKGITKVVGLESRGFILGGLFAYKLDAGFVPIRKPGKLPYGVFSEKYTLEYGFDEIQIHKDALNNEDIVLLHDDLLATGGTAAASIDLINNFNVQETYVNFLIELDFLNGRDRLPQNHEIYSLFHF